VEKNFQKDEKKLACSAKYGRKESLLNIPFRFMKSPERGGLFSRFRAFHFLGVKVNNEWRRRRVCHLYYNPDFLDIQSWESY
jgi:hypothetical protein